ncbi:hypothetical protein SOCEGT47_028270 [Sorangium cellulosum]|uniref:Secreted protein n=1 Tax=Sorangium cellulosum TaxID=56 RepID=A0A4P2Q0B4_SORCE|nr:hypothetical protein [Sorangium cellulosum]AUX22326.1 hypothetical protein SOCEGT47_028270 [Sorangium cellulosum]
MKLRAALLAPVLSLVGCAGEATPVEVEALAQSGRSAFLCLAIDRPDPEGPGVLRPLPITDCARRYAESPDDFEVDPEDEGRAKLPHLYALVTQTSRGEVAIVDLTTERSSILDLDPGTPGASFLPVGAQPVDIVATPGSTAAFVAVAEPGREGVFALPSARALPRDGCPVPSLSTWPSCSLGSPPGEMVLVSDPPGPDGKLRSSCSSDYDLDPEGAGEAGDGGACGEASGDLGREGLGRQKLIVTLPELGGLAVLDAQTLLEDERFRDGGFAPCEVERWVPLDVALPPAATPAVAPHGPECVEPATTAGAAQAISPPRPAGLALAGDRLFVADLDAPVIHVVDLPTPCEPVELPPLLPSSTLDPARLVTTSRIAVSQASPPDFRRFLYAVDAGDGSLMVFDVSDGATSRTPLARPHPEWNPFQPPDRIRFRAPVRDLEIVARDSPARLPATGVAPEGIRCDPDPGLRACDSTIASCDLETLYRTSADHDAGAGPRRLRGSFAYVVLTSGQVAVVDVDDLDAACRGPEVKSQLAGCEVAPLPGAPPDDHDADGIPNAPVLDPETGQVRVDGDDCPYYPNRREGDRRVDRNGDGIEDTCELRTSGEASCGVVLPHTPRSEDYILPSGGAGQREPGVQTLPLLYDRSGAIVQLSEERSPKMRATLPPEGVAAPDLTLGVGAERQPILRGQQGLVERSGELQHALVMNLEDPRVHIVNTGWTVTYEGALPGFSRTFVGFDGDESALGSSDARFCRRGVQSRASIEEQLLAAGLGEREASARAAQLADFVQITSELPDEDAAYWQASREPVCSYERCNAKYGSIITSRPGLRVAEAYEDHLVLESRDPDVDEVAFARCCFPGEVQLDVRAGGQWVVQDAGGGFLHHVIADPATGRCRNACDGRLARLNGRVVHTPTDGPVTDGEPGAFINPMFRFAITGGAPEQDMQFRFTTQGAFTPLHIELSEAIRRDDRYDVQPQAIRFIPATGELAITDGSLQGLILLSSSSMTLTHQFR